MRRFTLGLLVIAQSCDLKRERKGNSIAWEGTFSQLRLFFNRYVIRAVEVESSNNEWYNRSHRKIT